MTRFAWMLMVVFAAQNPVAALDLDLPKEFAAPGNNLVKLRRIGANPAPDDTVTNVTRYLSAALTADNRYTAALKAVEHQGVNQHFTYEFLVWRNSASRETTQILFNVTATGSFTDFFKDVPFTVTDGAVTASGELQIPVHPLDPQDQCKVVNLPTTAAPLQVFLNGDTEYTLSLDCGGAASIPRLVSLGSLVVGHREYWRRTDFNSQYWKNGPTAPVKTKAFDLLKAVVTPNVLPAVGARFKQLNIKESPHDTIAFDLIYAIQPGGVETRKKVEIPVVFHPFLSVIAGALWSGVVLGWLASCLLMLGLHKPKTWKDAGGALLLGLLLATVAYPLALLAYGANCRLQLLGLELNPSDVLALFTLGLVCGCVALLKLEELQKRLDGATAKVMSLGKAAPGLLVLLAGGVWCASANAGEGRLALVGLSACPDGDVIGLHKNGTVIQFPGASLGTWRPAGRLRSEVESTELTCATLDGRRTAFIVALALKRIWVVRMDIATGRWTEGPVAGGFSAGIAFDSASEGVFVSSPEDRTIYRISAALKKPEAYASFFDKAESITSLALDSARRRLLVGEAFSGIVYSLALDSRRKGTVASGLGGVSSLSIDGQRNLLYIADTGLRTIWVVPLAGPGPGVPRTFYRSDELAGVTGVAVDGDSNVWVGTYSPAEVTVLRPNGSVLKVMR